jgi:hypothetical protein
MLDEILFHFSLKFTFWLPPVTDKGKNKGKKEDLKQLKIPSIKE